MQYILCIIVNKQFRSQKNCNYSGPCILRPPIQPEIYGLKLKVILKI